MDTWIWITVGALAMLSAFVLGVVLSLAIRGRWLPNITFSQVRVNILVIATWIFMVCIGICFLIGKAIGATGDQQFVVGALIGLLGSGITGLAGLGTTLVTEAPPVQSNDQRQE